MSNTQWFDDPADSLNDRELPDGDDFDDDEGDDDDFDGDEGELLPCPECGADIYEESQQCPYCGSYVTFSTHPFTGRAWWWVALGLLGIIAMIVMLAIAGLV
jgi:hypothetical protein